MAAAIVQFIRKTPRASLKAYFDEKPHPVAQLVDWDDEKADPVKPLLKAVDEMTDTELAMLKIDAERIHEMTDEIGQRAISPRSQWATSSPLKRWTMKWPSFVPMRKALPN